jgi:hypothetical protein
VPLKTDPTEFDHTEALVLDTASAGFPTIAQDAAAEHTALSVTPEELTMAQLAAVVGSHCTVLGYKDADVGTGMGVGNTLDMATVPLTG